MGKETKTNAMRILDRMKIPYTLNQYQCDEFIDGIRPYNGKMILGIAALSCAIGFGCMALYQHPIIRYSIVVFLGIVALVCRKKLISLIKSLLQLKKQKVE